MVFWLAVLVGALFAWIAVRIGFYATWILFFHLLLAAYVAIFLAPVVIADVPAATAIPGYGYALTLVSIAVATLFVAYGTCYACLSGRLRLEFPRVLRHHRGGRAGLSGRFPGVELRDLRLLPYALGSKPTSARDSGSTRGRRRPTRRTCAGGATGFTPWLGVLAMHQLMSLCTPSE